MAESHSPELIPGLPEEIALDCLSGLPYSTHPVAARVSKRWRRLFLTRDFYYFRKSSGRTHKAACFIQSLPVLSHSKPIPTPRFGISVWDPVDQTWERIEPVPKYPNGMPIFCQVTGCEGKLVVMGGWDPDSYEPLSHVFVYDFTTGKWRQGEDMPEKRSFFGIGELKGRVMVAGGHDENKSALSSAWAYDVAADEWSELPRMSQERDECEGVVIGSDFWVVSGYKTESQGQFEGSAEVLAEGARGWKRVEGAWEEGGCPKWCVGSEGGRFRRLGGTLSGVKGGVHCGDWALVNGSTYEGGPQGFYHMEGPNGRCKRLQGVPDEFCGLVQSSCFLEI